VAGGGGNFWTRYDKQTVHRQAVFTHKAVLKKVVNAGAGIMIGNGKSVQTLSPGGGHHVFGFSHAIGRKPRVTMEINIKFHANSLKRTTSQKAKEKECGVGG